MMQCLHCQRAMASWIPTSRSNSFFKLEVEHDGFLFWKKFITSRLEETCWIFHGFYRGTRKKAHTMSNILTAISGHFPPIVFNHYFSDFSNPPKNKSQGAFPSPPASPKKMGPFFSPKAHLEHHLSDFASAPPCSAPVPLPLESKVVVAPTLRPDVGPRAGRRWGGMLMLWDTWFYYLKKAGKEMWFLKKMANCFFEKCIYTTTRFKFVNRDFDS